MTTLNLFMHDVVKWPNILLKSCGVNKRFYKSVPKKKDRFGISNSRINESVG